MGGALHDRDFCGHCDRHVRGIRPHWGIKLSFAVVVFATVGVVAMGALLGWGLLLAAPLFAGVGMSIGPLAHAAFAPATCPRCGRIVTEDQLVAHASQARAPRLAGLPR